MVVNENANESIIKFLSTEKVIRVYEALKIGLEKDNLVVIDVFLQNLLQQVFQELPKVVTIDIEELESNQRTDSIKKFIKGEDTRFNVGLDFVCNYVLKNKKLWYNIKGLSINENANLIKYFEEKDLEYSSADEIKNIYNMLIDALNKTFESDVFSVIEL